MTLPEKDQSAETPPSRVMTGMDFSNKALFGADPQPGLVAVERAGNDAVEVFLREGGAVRSEKFPLRPILWSARGGPGAHSLEGDLALSHLIVCPGWKEFQDLQRTLKSAGIPAFAWNDPVIQFLAITGKTLFKGLELGDVRRLQLDIETDTTEKGRFSNPRRDQIAAIALSDNTGWEELLLARPDSADSEKEILEACGRRIRERDPDIIEGHNLFRFDLPFLAARARKHGLKLAWGRGGEPATSRSSRLQIAERTIQYERFAIRGRHVVDTLVLAQHYDIATRELDSFGLKSVARHLGVAEPDRVHIPGEEISNAWRTGSPDFATYALQDVRETRAIASALSGSYFYQARIFPLNYQDVILRGNATKIDTLFLREYLRRGHSIPMPPAPEEFGGGLTEIFQTGVIRDVWHCDASSLYPSIMLAFGISPGKDSLGIFPGLLADLRTFRLQAKAAARAASDPGIRSRLDALQQAFKILINSFYGYLGFSQGHFADFAAAREVTARGRQILSDMVDWLERQGARVIEIDTDGVYFHPPEGAAPEVLDAGMAAHLPEGIEVEFGNRYKAMFSYKAKNYALLGRDGQITIKGGALKSRGMEPYLRDYLGELIRRLLEGDSMGAADLEGEFIARVESGAIPVSQLAKTEALQDSPEAYQRKIAASSRNRSAAYEIALKSGRSHAAGDQIRYYISGSNKRATAYEAAKPLEAFDPKNPDINIPYYRAKLSDLAKKFQAFLPDPQSLF